MVGGYAACGTTTPRAAARRIGFFLAPHGGRAPEEERAAGIRTITVRVQGIFLLVWLQRPRLPAAGGSRLCLPVVAATRRAPPARRAAARGREEGPGGLRRGVHLLLVRGSVAHRRLLLLLLLHGHALRREARLRDEHEDVVHLLARHRLAVAVERVADVHAVDDVEDDRGHERHGDDREDCGADAHRRGHLGRELDGGGRGRGADGRGEAEVGEEAEHGGGDEHGEAEDHGGEAPDGVAVEEVAGEEVGDGAGGVEEGLAREGGADGGELAELGDELGDALGDGGAEAPDALHDAPAAAAVAALLRRLAHRVGRGEHGGAERERAEARAERRLEPLPHGAAREPLPDGQVEPAADDVGDGEEADLKGEEDHPGWSLSACVRIRSRLE